MRKQTLIFFSISVISMVSYGQQLFSTTEHKDLITLAYSNYLDIDGVQIDDKTIGIDFTSLLEQPKFGLGIAYTNHGLDFKDYDTYHNYNTLNTLHTVEIYARYKEALARNWNLNLTVAPYLSSTFQHKTTSSDWVFSYAANVIKTWDNEGGVSTLKLGVGYGALYGKPNFYPLLSYSKNVNEKFRYEIGIPVSGVYFKLNQQNHFDFTIQPASIYASNASGFNINNNELDEASVEFKAIKMGLGYEFCFDSNWSTYFNVGYLVDSELTINDNGNKIYDFDDTETLSLNIGISFNINNK